MRLKPLRFKEFPQKCTLFIVLLEKNSAPILRRFRLTGERCKGVPREFRFKDLHDIARILRARPASNEEFWTKADGDLQLACQSRLVDCQGLESFMENWSLARERYEADGSLRNVTFDEAERALKIVAGLIEGQRIFPLEFPIP